MSPERYRQVTSIFQAAVELGPDERASFLERECSHDAELKREVLSLLEHDQQSREFLEKPAVEAVDAGLHPRPGSRIGPYEIIEPIGAGEMGEVFRARDSRFEREVAIKLLPAGFTQDPSRLSRFEREARAAGSLNHPNILTVHDFGYHNGAPYLVSELLQGETLRERLKKPGLPPAAAIAYAAQIANGLGAAHSRGVVHRDLKPENIFVTRGGAVKILDFGLAKLPQPHTETPGQPPASPTEPGMVLGTFGYMSPEQVRGEPADNRADIFSLGVILYEMLADRRPFGAPTWIEEMDAILRVEPADLPADLPGVSDPAAVARTVRRCLAKQREDRFESARDLAFILESLPEPARRKPPAKRARRVLRGAVAAAALAAGAFLAAYGFRPSPAASFQRLTFRRGVVSAARFTTDGNTIVYSAAWDLDDFRVYSTRPDNSESHPLGTSPAMLFAVSSHGDLALCFPTGRNQHGVVGRLARVPLSGGGPLERAENVSSADWSPDGSDLAVVRLENDRAQIEYPVGKVLYRSRLAGGYVETVRVSPRGDSVAFLDHPLLDDSAGWVAVADLAGNYRALSTRFNSTRGLAWSPDGKELWFAAAKHGTNLALYAVNLSGKVRMVARFPAYISLEDVSRDRRVLLSVHEISASMVHVPDSPEGPNDLYWHDESQVRDISRDGKAILFSESGDATGQDYDAYIRGADGSSPAVRLGVGLPLSLSPDSRWVIANPAGSPARLTILPTGPGDPKPLTADNINHVGASWLPDGKGFVFAGITGDESLRYYVQRLTGGAPQPITDADIRYERRSPIVVSPDGQFVAAIGKDKPVLAYPTTAGEPRTVPGLEPGFTPLQWCPDDRLVLHRYDEPAPRLWKVDIKTGKLVLWKALNPPNPVGLLDLAPIRVRPDCRAYAYSPLNVLSQVYLTTGLR